VLERVDPIFADLHVELRNIALSISRTPYPFEISVWSSFTITSVNPGTFHAARHSPVDEALNLFEQVS